MKIIDGLLNKFGISNKVDDCYYKCVKCNSLYRLRDNHVLQQSNLLCRKCDADLLNPDKLREYRELLEKKCPTITCLELKAGNLLSKFICTNCGTIFEKRSGDVLKLKQHCKKKVNFDINSVLTELNTSILGIKKDVYLLNKDGYTWSTKTPISSIYSKHHNKSERLAKQINGRLRKETDIPYYTKKGVEIIPDVYKGKSGYKIIEFNDHDIEYYGKHIVSGLIYVVYVKQYDKLVVLKEFDANKIRSSILDKIIVLGIDPGTTSMGWTAFKIDKKFKPKILATGMFSHNIKTIDYNLNNNILDFENELIGLIDQYNITHIGAERYQSRRMGGTTIECVNMMLGVISVIGRKLDINVTLVIPSVWKNQWNRYSNLEEFYKKTNVFDHQCDSLGQGLYCAYRWFGLKPFENIADMEAGLARQMDDRTE